MEVLQIRSTIDWQQFQRRGCRTLLVDRLPDDLAHRIPATQQASTDNSSDFEDVPVTHFSLHHDHR